MTNEQKVLAFRDKLGLPVGYAPQLLSHQQILFFARFLSEEVNELILAHEHEDLASAFDALIDLVYVAYGCAIQMGLPFEEGFDIVHNCNMQKVPGMTKRKSLGQDATKPPGWVGPEAALTALLYKEMS
jgi:predicted HAD superfamily Cof-like phosphohydrolase